jgi:hypothetical protein
MKLQRKTLQVKTQRSYNYLIDYLKRKEIVHENVIKHVRDTHLNFYQEVKRQIMTKI